MNQNEYQIETQNKTAENPIKKERFITNLPLICAVLSIIIALSYFLAMKFEFDEKIGHFAVSSPFAAICTTAAAVSILCAVYLSLSYRTKKYALAPNTPERTSLLYMFCATFASVTAICLAFIELKSNLPLLNFYKIGTAGIFPLYKEVPFRLVFDILASAFLPFISAALLLSLLPKKRISALHSVFAIIAVLAPVSGMFSVYFNFDIPLNSPVKCATTVLYAATVVYLLANARTAMPDKYNRRDFKVAIVSSTLGATIALGLSGGIILNCIFNSFDNDPNVSLIRAALYFAISLTAISRTVTLRECAIIKPDEPAQGEESAENSGEKTDNEKID